MDDYTRLLNKVMEDPEFRKEWDALEPEFQEIKRKIRHADGILKSYSNPELMKLEKDAFAKGIADKYAKHHLYRK